MRFRALRIVALILISLINIFLFLILIIVLAHLVEALFSNDQKPIFQDIDSNAIIGFLSIVLSLVGAVYSWKKPKIGAIFTIVAALGLIFSGLDDMHLGSYPLYALLIGGVLLLYYALYNERYLRKFNNELH